MRVCVHVHVGMHTHKGTHSKKNEQTIFITSIYTIKLKPNKLLTIK